MSLSEEAQAVIKDEERILGEVVESLHGQMIDARLRLQTHSREARELTSRMVNARRDVDRELIASDEAVAHQLRDSKKGELATLERLIERPYFARLVVEEHRGSAPVEIEYKLGTAANIDCRIIDWRKAPIARLYYEYQEGDEYEEEILDIERAGRVKLRNRLGIEGGELKKVVCRHGTFIRQDGSWLGIEETRAGREGSGGGLKSIVSLITPEQFRMITEDAKSAVLIQGIAGSGKTTVALHRLAWLLHEDNSDLKPEQALVLVSGRALQSYVAAIIPALGIEGIEVHSASSWLQTQLKRLQGADPQLAPLLDAERHPLPPGIERLKRSRALAAALSEMIAEERNQTLHALDEAINWERLPEQLRAERIRCRSGALPLGAFLERLQAACERQGAPVAQLPETLANLRRLDERLRRLFERPQRIIAHDGTSLLDTEMVRRAAEHTLQARAAGRIDSADEALLLRLHQATFGSELFSSLDNGTLRHVVADEVQELSPAELDIIIDAVSDASQLTLVGDIKQQSSMRSQFVGWEWLQERLSGKGEGAVLTALTVSHRSTLPIMRLADYVSGSDRTREGRRGKPPLWFLCRTENEGVRQALGWLERVVSRYPDTMVAVLCRTGDEARHVLTLLKPTFGSAVRLGDEHSFTFQDGIVVTSVAEVKGLEFSNVLIWNPSARAYPPKEQSRNLLYIAITRAEEHLCIVSWGQPTPLLPSVRSKLVRGHEPELEEE